MRTQSEKGAAFRALHERAGAFVIPNPWDVGTAKMLAVLGFEALATTSSGYAFSTGRKDGNVGREKMLAHAREIVNATDLPVSADFENGYAADLNGVADTYRLAGEAGLAGASIENSTRRPDAPLFEIKQAAERVRAAAEAAHALPYPFTLTARAENFLVGKPDLKDTLKRLQAYQEAGADVLFAPGLTKKDEIEAVVKSVDRPVNHIMFAPGVRFGIEELAALGVKRISIGSSLARAALGAFLRGAREIKDRGTFTYLDDAASGKEIGALLEP
ncbi:MAG: isocitrate lyase/phosphoenolpyruvate mutase family protein [Planctomycetes bacterium]|nr:isocitrate lyase/phosphoenolpyruvate mutase family protein [Planctomycetota bacterium]